MGWYASQILRFHCSNQLFRCIFQQLYPLLYQLQLHLHYLFFTLSDTEVFIPPSQLEECNSEKGLIAYPKDWVQNFGEEYYKVKTGTDTNFDIPSTEVTYKTDEAMEKCTSPEELKEKINVIKETLYECNTTEQ